MLKKKYLLSLVAVLLVAVYSAGMYFSFSNAKDGAFNEMQSFESEITDKVFEYCSLSDENGKVNLSLEEIIAELSGYTGMPYSVCFFDEDGRLAGRNQDYIRFWENGDERYCFIGDYLTDEISKKLRSMYNDRSLSGECWFYYLDDENGMAVPVTFVFKNPNNKNLIDEIKFMDYDQYGDDDKQFGTYLTVNGEVTKKVQSPLHIVEFELPQLLSKGYIADGYREVLGKIVDGDGNLIYKEDFEEDNYFFNDRILNISLESSGDYYPITLKDGSYSIYIVAKINPVLYGLNDPDFKTQAVTMTIVCAFAYAIAVAFIECYFKKQMLSRARYDFANAAAHELKTPLAVIQNQCECIMENVNADNNAGYVQSIYEEALRMNKLVKNLLEYNSLSSQGKLKSSSVNLSLLIGSEINKYKSLLSAKDLSIISDVEPECYVNCNDELIALVVDNFLSNAVKFAEIGSDISVSLHQKDKKYVVSVFNKGSKISRKNDKSLWTLLYKEDESRSDSSSSGMGLAVSARILDLHKFKYGYVNRDDGVEFYFVAK